MKDNVAVALTVAYVFLLITLIWVIAAMKGYCR